MSRILPVHKHLEHFPDSGVPYWRGSMWRPATEGEQGDPEGMRRIWAHDGIGGYIHFDTEASAEAWKAVEVECWLKRVAPTEFGDDDKEYEVVVRQKDLLFSKLTDNELHTLMEFLDDHTVEHDLDIGFETLKRLGAAATAENNARAMAAKRLMFEHGIMP